MNSTNNSKNSIKNVFMNSILESNINIIPPNLINQLFLINISKNID